MKNSILIILLLISIPSFAQEITGEALLESAINFHDPNGRWTTFKGEFMVTMKTPKSTSRKSIIQIDLPAQYFAMTARKDTIVTEYTLDKQGCCFSFNGNKNPSEKIIKKYNLNCERARMYKNYYSYLYGLPMKLKDKGTLVHKIVTRKTFKGKEYLVLKVNYSKNVGKDTWYFYFDPKTHAMEVYQFFKETKDSGEYILLSGLETINEIKMPKVRAWYYNKDNLFLGTDILSSIKE